MRPARHPAGLQHGADDGPYRRRAGARHRLARCGPDHHRADAGARHSTACAASTCTRRSSPHACTCAQRPTAAGSSNTSRTRQSRPRLPPPPCPDTNTRRCRCTSAAWARRCAPRTGCSPRVTRAVSSQSARCDSTQALSSGNWSSRHSPAPRSVGRPGRSPERAARPGGSCRRWSWAARRTPAGGPAGTARGARARACRIVERRLARVGS